MKISVVIPVYNRQHTIATCIEGIYNTKYTDFEVCIIDDGSSDDTVKVCKELVDKYPNLRVEQQVNQGVSVARNRGIDIARGEYIVFVDSDDTLAPDALSRIADYVSQDVDFVMYRVAFCRPNEITREIEPFPKEKDVCIEGNERVVKWIFTTFQPYKRGFYQVWTKAFKRKILIEKNIRFRSDLFLGEDQVFVCDFLQHAESMYFTETKCYYLIKWPLNKREGGLGSAVLSPEDFLYNQRENYKSLIALYENTSVREVKVYAVNYILDRPITRILYGHLNRDNKNRVSFFKLWKFLKSKIAPLIMAEYENISMFRDKKVARYLRLIKRKSYLKLMIYIMLDVNKKKNP